MLDPPTDFAHRVHLPWGYLPAGRKVRAACSCGFLTTARVTEERALVALLSEHGYTDPVCATCGKNHQYGRAYESQVSRWEHLRHVEIQILPDDATGGTFLVCRDMPESCRAASAQKLAAAERDVAEAFGTDRPRPALRLIVDVDTERGAE